MKTLKMLTKGPNGNYRKGQVVEVDEQRAALLIEGKHAEEVMDGNASGVQERQGLQRGV